MKDRLTFQNFKKFMYENKTHFIAFFIPVIILLAAYANVGIYPFGEKSILAVDFSTQYVYFFDYMRDVLSGKESLFYNWSGSLSSGFYGTFAYYIASPFNIIVLLFPKENITEGLLTMLLTKIGCVGLTTSLFLRKHRGCSEFTSVLFSGLFALCGYTVANTINPMWLDAVAALPLITMGIERLCEKRLLLLYTLSLLFAIIANYYTGYMLCIFSALYFIYYFFSRDIAQRRLKLGIFALSSVSAGLMSGFMLIPAFMPLFDGKLGRGPDKFEIKESFNITDALLKLFPTVYDTQRYGGLPFIYCGLFALILAVIYFFCKEFPLRERIAGGILCGLLMFSMYLKPLDNLWHGGRAPVWFEHRFSFLLIFLLIVLGASAFENIENISLKHICTVFFILLGVLLTASGMKEKQFYNEQHLRIIPIILLGIAAMAVALAKGSSKLPSKAAVFALVFIELYLNCKTYTSNINTSFVYQERDDYTTQISEMREIADEIKMNDDGFFRIEKTFHRAFNDNIGAGMYGVSFSSSVYNEKVLKMMRNLGFGQYDWHTRYNGSTMLTDDILGIKYIMSKDEGLVPYSKTYGIVYTNSDALPLAFLADENILGSTFGSSSPFEFQQELASMLTGEHEEIFTQISSYDRSIQNLTQSGNNYNKIDSNSLGSATYSFYAPESGSFYTYIPTSTYRSCALYVNGKYLRNYFNTFDHNVAYLGDFSQGEQISVEIRLNNDDANFDDPVFRVLDKTALESFNAKIPRNSVQKTGNCSFEVLVNAEEDCALFTTIPYAKGWSAYIDGKRCAIGTAVNDTLMCVSVPRGEHNITFKYAPEGFVGGIAVTVCGAVLFAGMIVARRKFSTKQT